MSTPPRVQAHEALGRYVEVDGHRIFVREEGSGAPVLLLHGVPSSSFLYRKVGPLIAARGFRAISFDFLGVGLSDKPADADYDWHALARFLGRLVEVLELPAVHLVVHDIAGPIGMEWAIQHPDRVRSITVMNTLLDVAVFRPPFPMWTFRVPALRQVAFATQHASFFLPLMRRIGVKHKERIDYDDVAAWIWLLKRAGGRTSFLQIMAGFDLSEAHGRFLRRGILGLQAPKQLVWGEGEIAIPEHQLNYIRSTFSFERELFVDGRHFPQEDVPKDVAAHIADFAASVDG
ncbi:MAG: alpha/beta fold hydrolase [Myxococcota bacterium]